MKKVVAIVVGILVLGVAVVLGIAATKPDDTHIERSALIKASPEAILANVNDYKKWKTWSPWEKVDPNMKRSYSGPESGKGAKCAWEGNDEVGVGNMEILSTEPTKTVLKLHFDKPFEGDNIVTFTVLPEGDASKVTWAMDSKDNPFMCKVAQVFVNMDEVCGKEFDKGLKDLKTISENPDGKPTPTAQEGAQNKPATAHKETGDNG